MSAMRFSTLIAAVAATILLTLTYILEGVARADLVPEPVTVLGSVSVVISWLGFFCAHCRDTIIDTLTKRAAKHTSDVLVAINAAVEEAGDRRATEARIDTIAAYNQVPPQGRPTRMHPVN